LGVRTLGCAGLFPDMVFSQLTWRESLSDIKVCLEANQAKLFHVGIATLGACHSLSSILQGWLPKSSYLSTLNAAAPNANCENIWDQSTMPRNADALNVFSGTTIVSPGYSRSF
jgi:hypothetical protein